MRVSVNRFKAEMYAIVRYACARHMWLKATSRRPWRVTAVMAGLFTLLIFSSVNWHLRDVLSMESNGTSKATSKLIPQPPILCLFTTFKPVEYKTFIYQNVLRNWALLSPSRVRPVLFVPSSDRDLFSRQPSFSANGQQPVSHLNQTIIDLAAYFGWLTIVPPRINNQNVPHLKEMFYCMEKLLPNCVFYGYANGDVLFDDGLPRTLEAVAEVLGPLRKTLIVGQRTNFELKNREVYLPSDVHRLARNEGRLFISDAQDYFLITNNFPWTFVPDVVVGRPGYDNFLVAMAIRRGVSVVDATRSLVALHQTDQDGNFAGHNRNNSDCEFNLRAIGKRFRYHGGHTTRSQYVTLVDGDEGKVTVHRRYSRRRVWSSFWKQIGFF